MGWVVNSTPRPLYLRERPGTHCTGSWEGPRAGLDRCGKSRTPPGFDPRTVHPVASRYNDHKAVRPGWGLSIARMWWYTTNIGSTEIYNIWASKHHKLQKSLMQEDSEAADHRCRIFSKQFLTRHAYLQMIKVTSHYRRLTAQNFHIIHCPFCCRNTHKIPQFYINLWTV